MEKKMNKDEWIQYRQIRENKKLDPRTQKIIAELHSKYFKHTYHVPCSCSGKTWQQWIGHLNEIYSNGYRENP